MEVADAEPAGSEGGEQPEEASQTQTVAEREAIARQTEALHTLWSNHALHAPRLVVKLLYTLRAAWFNEMSNVDGTPCLDPNVLTKEQRLDLLNTICDAVPITGVQLPPENATHAQKAGASWAHLVQVFQFTRVSEANLMRRLQAALRLVPPQKFRADRDPGISVDVAIGRFELEIDPGYRRPFTKEAVRRTIRLVRIAMEQGRIQRLGTTCPCCRLTEQAVYLTVGAVQAARPNLCEFCGEMYVRIANLSYPKWQLREGEVIEEVD